MAYSFLDIINIWWHGQKQTILYYAPLIKPEKELGAAPPWFTEVWPGWLWDYYLDSERRPTETWLYNYNYAAKQTLKGWLDQLKADAVNDAAAWVWSWTGGPAHGYTTLAAWLEAIRSRVGTFVPAWTFNLAAGVNDLYWKLPEGIRNLSTSWNQLWDSIKQSVKDWAKERYDSAKATVQTVWEWVTVQGQTLTNWYNSVAGWVNGFKADPYGFITGHLGDTWRKLRDFARDALDFYYNLWGASAQELSNFLADPGGFILEKAENEIIKRW